MHRPLRLLFLLVCGAALMAAAATTCCAAERRVALVIGNSSYASPGLNIPNARNDAEDTAAALKALGFDVLLATDVDLAAASKAIQQFARMSIGADATLFYFAGHAVQFQGENYLLPVDAEVRDEISLPFETIAVDNIRAALDRSSGVKIMVLDACRTNPVSERLARLSAPSASAAASIDSGERTRGIQRVDRSEGMIVAFSTSPGDVALDGQDRNSPFTKAFLRRLREPGLEIETMFRRITADVSEATGGRQRPETYVSLTSEYYLNQDDSIAWEKIAGTSDPAVLNDFLEHFPSSFYAIEARYRLAALQRAIAAAAAEAQREAEVARREAEVAAKEAAARLKAEQACGNDLAAVAAIGARDADGLRRLIPNLSCDEVKIAAADRLAALEGRTTDAALCEREDGDLKALIAKGDAAGIEALRTRAQCPATSAAAGDGLRAIAAAAEAADACQRDQAAWRGLTNPADRAAIEAFRQRATCPEVISAVDKTLADLASACARDQSALAAIAPNDDAALKAFAAGPVCDDARTAAQAKIASLEAAAEEDCRREDAELAALKAKGGNRREELIDLKGRLTCPRLRSDVEAALEQTPPPARPATVKPESSVDRLLRRPKKDKAAKAPAQDLQPKAVEPRPAKEKEKPSRPAAVDKPAHVARPAQAPPARATAQAASPPSTSSERSAASPLGVGF